MANSGATCVYGARIISKHVGAMAAEVDGVRAAKDIEFIHRMRVASRRTRSALTLFEACFPKAEFKAISKDMRKVTRALGEARDLDVQLKFLDKQTELSIDPKNVPGIKRLQLRLRQRRADAQVHVGIAMDRLVADEVLQRTARWAAPLLSDAGAVYLYSPALYQLAFSGVHRSLEALLLHVPFIHDEENKTELHAMRISAKRLRYTLEAFEDLYGAKLKPFISQTRKLQDLLGVAHDLDVWIELIPAFIEEERARISAYFGNERPLKRLLPGLEAFRTARISQRHEIYQEFLKEWGGIEDAHTWDELLQLINTPLDLDTALKALQDAQAELEAAHGDAMPAPDELLTAQNSTDALDPEYYDE